MSDPHVEATAPPAQPKRSAKRRKRKKDPYLCLFRIGAGGRVTERVREAHHGIVRGAVLRDAGDDLARAAAMAGDQAEVVDRAVDVLRAGADTQVVAVMAAHRDALLAVRDELEREAVARPEAAAQSDTAAQPEATRAPAPAPVAKRRLVVRLKQ